MAAVNIATDLADLTGWVGNRTSAVRVLVLDETGGGRRCHKQRAADVVVPAAAEAAAPEGRGQRSMAAMFASSWRSPAAGVRLFSRSS